MITLPSRQRIFGTLCGVADVSDVRAAFKVWHDCLTLNGGSRFLRKVGNLLSSVTISLCMSTVLY